ncbi:MAG TPA: phosphotransferase [Ktedonobacteraceae bacterium]|nr:phosphotransferase [Ktedonobacteraceae bacterium]
MSIDASDINTNLSILDLPNIVTLLYQRANQSLLPDAQATPGLFVRHLRRKPARGLAIIYTVDELGRAYKAHSNAPDRYVSLTLDEQALDGAHIRFTKAQAEQVPIEVQETGVLRAEEIGLSVQAFPADNSLPALAASCDTTPHSILFAALQAAAHTQLRDDTWQLVSARAVPVRYKPANRCVIRYNLALQRGNEDGATARNLTIFGKVYADPQQARTVQALQQRLYDEQANKTTIVNNTQSEKETSIIAHGGNSPFLPRPLGIIETLGLTFNAAVQPMNLHEQLLIGTRALRPKMQRDKGGEITELVIPTEELWLTAIALSRLHSSAVRPDEKSPRTGAKEAKRARERASLIAGHNPLQAEEVLKLADQLATRLEALEPDAYRPAHGGFKASQLLFHSHKIFIVDFDGFCLADPALDVGYFLAYLRPSGLWYHLPGMMPWFKSAAETFTSTYRHAMIEQGITEETITGILQRSKLYEAALLFKIATRRVNRLNSPRPKELAAMLEEISACLSI